MPDYTPTTEEVRAPNMEFMYLAYNLFRLPRASEEVTNAEFDRWLAEVKADAWQEGWVSRNDYLSHFENPYREGEK